MTRGTSMTEPNRNRYLSAVQTSHCQKSCSPGKKMVQQRHRFCADSPLTEPSNSNLAPCACIKFFNSHTDSLHFNPFGRASL